MAYRDLRDFIEQLERDGELRRIAAEVDPKLEMTAVCDRVLARGGPALLFERPAGGRIDPGAQLYRLASSEPTFLFHKPTSSAGSHSKPSIRPLSLA